MIQDPSATETYIGIYGFVRAPAKGKLPLPQVLPTTTPNGCLFSAGPHGVSYGLVARISRYLL